MLNNSLLRSTAARQHGVVTRPQLVAAGLDANAIAYRVKTGQLLRLHRNVYALAYRARSPHQTLMAAVLACGGTAALSHRSAAALWEIHGCAGPIEVSTTSQHCPHGIRVHRRAKFATTRRFGIPITTPAQTIADLERLLDARQLTRARNEAMRRGYLASPDTPTRSILEDDFLAFVRAHELPLPQVNQLVAGYEVDMLWPEARLIAELDGYRFHRHAFEADRARDADLLEAGYRVVRITWKRLTDDARREARRLRKLLMGA